MPINTISHSFIENGLDIIMPATASNKNKIVGKEIKEIIPIINPILNKLVFGFGLLYKVQILLNAIIINVLAKSGADSENHSANKEVKSKKDMPVR